MDSVKEIKTFHFSNAVAEVTIPDLAPEEYARRHRQVEQAAAELLQSAKTAGGQPDSDQCGG